VIDSIELFFLSVLFSMVMTIAYGMGMIQTLKKHHQDNDASVRCGRKINPRKYENHERVFFRYCKDDELDKKAEELEDKLERWEKKAKEKAKAERTWEYEYDG